MKNTFIRVSLASFIGFIPASSIGKVNGLALLGAVVIRYGIDSFLVFFLNLASEPARYGYFYEPKSLTAPYGVACGNKVISNTNDALCAGFIMLE